MLLAKNEREVMGRYCTCVGSACQHDVPRPSSLQPGDELEQTQRGIKAACPIEA